MSETAFCAQAEKDVLALVFWRQNTKSVPVALILEMRERAEGEPKYARALAEAIMTRQEEEGISNAELARIAAENILPVL